MAPTPNLSPEVEAIIRAALNTPQTQVADYARDNAYRTNMMQQQGMPGDAQGDVRHDLEGQGLRAGSVGGGNGGGPNGASGVVSGGGFSGQSGGRVGAGQQQQQQGGGGEVGQQQQQQQGSEPVS
ncbi:hypothetical protein HK097_000493, partial [Rhizophlyctis rosea]